MSEVKIKVHPQWQERATILAVADFIFTLVAFFLALWVRHDMRFSEIPEELLETYIHTAPLWAIITIVVLYMFRLYHSIWSMASVPEMYRMIKAYLLLIAVFLVFVYATGIHMPRSYYVMGTMLNFMFSVTLRFSYRLVRFKVQDANGNLIISADCATELPEGVANDDGTITYTYTLKDGLKWSNGDALTAKDFAFAWKRAASSALGADYGYMFEVVKGYPDELAVEATDDKTIVITLNNAVAYWNELLAFPTYFPVREDVVANEGWATDASTYVSNGAYTMTGWEHNSTITLTKNENYHGAADVTMNEIKFYLSDDANNMLTNFKNGTWQLIDDVPTNEIAALKVEFPEEFVVAGQIGTYYVCWNINEPLLPQE